MTIAHYKILSKLGEGGMGVVYRATDTKLNRDVAIKVVPEAFAADKDRMARFAREAQVLASLNHPNIAAIYGVEERALVLELVEGPTLAERIEQGKIPLAEALPICRQIAEALEYAHDKGIIHRDLKPANVKLTNDGNAKVLDFGLAKALSNEPMTGDPGNSPTLTIGASMAGMIMGTAAYKSPEQARGIEADRRADNWSFGVMFYEMLTGRRMFGGDSISDTLAAVLKTDPDWSALPPDTPPAIRRLLRRCLERDRKQRLSHIGDARLEIDEALAGAPEAQIPSARRGIPIWVAALLGLTTLACLAGTLVFLRETAQPAVPVRFQIPPPENTSFGGTAMALSPDGRQLAFIASGADRRQSIWVRPLDSVAAHALPGTEGANSLPFWSPDSRTIGFLVQGKLKKIEASGGPPQTLCEVPGILLAGSWSREGTIIFGTPDGGLMRVPQAGGMAVQLTTSDRSKGELGHLRPWFLSDGRHFLYWSRTVQPENAAIYLATLDGKERKRLVSSKQTGAYAPPTAGSVNGHLLFLREGTLMALPLDAKRFEPAGEPFPVAEQVGSRLAMGFFSVSANGLLAYRHGRSGIGPLAWFDRQGKSLATLGSNASYYSGPTLSPDGKRVAVDQLDSMGNRDVWVLDVVRGVPSRFTFDALNDVSPVWSSNGTRLAFASDRSTQGIFDIYMKDSSGSGKEELLLKTGSSMYPNDWSPDGRYLLYNAASEKTGYDLWVLPVQGASPEDRKPVPYLQTPFNERLGQFSPDGRWIAYTSDESGSLQVYVQSFPAGAGKFQVSTAGGSQPRWRREGKEMFYIGTDGRLMAVDVKTSAKFEAGEPKALFDPQLLVRDSAEVYVHYDVTADGKRFLVNSLNSAADGPAEAPITVVVNWLAGVKR